MTSYFQIQQLLSPPTKRAAFSDRTAYLMAEMSRLAYFRFEGGANVDEVLALAKSFIDDPAHYNELAALIQESMPSSSEKEATEVLGNILAANGFTLLHTFNDTTTDAQAFLCLQPQQKMAILAFRGTEKKLKDIKADVSAELLEVAYGYNHQKSVQIHSGYYGQFASLRPAIEAALNDERLNDCQLFITGHSLGGALAITATKFLACDTLTRDTLSGDIRGACYTFGSPPVGTAQFDEDIKTPIYRIINYVDIVPRLPNPYAIGVLKALSWLVELALAPLGKVYSRIERTHWYQKAQILLMQAGTYRQSGYGSYLVGNGAQAKLRYNVTSYDRAKWWLCQCKNLFRGDFEIISDHSIHLYADKLGQWAVSRMQYGQHKCDE